MLIERTVEPANDLVIATKQPGGRQGFGSSGTTPEVSSYENRKWRLHIDIPHPRVTPPCQGDSPWDGVYQCVDAISYSRKKIRKHVVEALLDKGASRSVIGLSVHRLVMTIQHKICMVMHVMAGMRCVMAEM